MYERSRNLLDCHIAGFAYYDGLEVIGDMKLGAMVSLKSEPDNPYDPNAVAIYLGEHKLGYIPKAKNEQVSTLLYFGYDESIQTRISSVNLDAEPERQFRVVLKIKDNRKS